MAMLLVCGQHLEQEELGLPPSLTVSRPCINVKERSSFCYWDWEREREREKEGCRGREEGRQRQRHGGQRFEGRQARKGMFPPVGAWSPPLGH